MGRPGASRVGTVVLMLGALAEHAVHKPVRLAHLLRATQHLRQREDVDVVLGRAVVRLVGRQVPEEAAQVVPAGARGKRRKDVPGDGRVARRAGGRSIVCKRQRHPGVVASVNAPVRDPWSLVVPSLWLLRLIVRGGEQRQRPAAGPSLVQGLGSAGPQLHEARGVEDSDKGVQDLLRLGQPTPLRVVDGGERTVVRVIPALRIALWAGPRQPALPAAGPAAQVAPGGADLQQAEGPRLLVKKAIHDLEALLPVATGAAVVRARRSRAAGAESSEVRGRPDRTPRATGGGPPPPRPPRPRPPWWPWSRRPVLQPQPSPLSRFSASSSAPSAPSRGPRSPPGPLAASPRPWRWCPAV
mmetsp:Transcript_31/g.90  ORF Transcript_31/g.90 Transcript_31/m.90 type:complete len:356 (+) Transcript_31:823-1890(+)